MKIRPTSLLWPLSGALLIVSLITACATQQPRPEGLTLHEREYFARPGVNVLAFSSPPGGMFFDAKTSGIEVIHHGERTATNGDVRLLHTPEQWDGMGEFVERVVNRDDYSIETQLAYPEHDFSYRVRATADGQVVRLSVHLDDPLPAELVGKAGFNMEFLPAAYFGKGYLMDGNSGLFPRHPSGPMNVTEEGLTEPTPFTTGSTFVLAPEDPEHRITVREATGDNQLMVFDGRNKAQNGWYVVRSLIPEGQSGKVIEWELDVHGIPGWQRDPVISYSQVGYHPAQPKTAIIELDAQARPESRATLLRVDAEGNKTRAHRGEVESWGNYLRYQYVSFDFSSVTEPGLYVIEYGDQTTKPFRIDPSVHEDTWHLTLDVFFPVQMDHMKVREAYRVWHGASHLDDALQAPANYEHFDLYAHGPETDTNFETFEHIPGLNYGGWYDAGDYDIRTQSQYFTVQHLVHTWEQFGIDRDNTTVSQEKLYTEIHRPDGNPDILQQIEHGTLALIAQHRAIGHAIPGIVAGHLYQYPHLGDGSTKTDNRVYNPELDPYSDQRTVGDMYNPSTDAPAPEDRVMATDGLTSGRFDDRWAFTTNTTALNYGSAAALTAASRALRGYNDELADECLETAQNVWVYEQNREPNLFRHGNTTGGLPHEEQLKAAVELLITTGEQQYADAVRDLLPQVEERFGANAFMLALALPHMDQAYAQRLEELTRQYREDIREHEAENPFGVPITRGGWAGAGTVINFGIANYWLHKAFPDIVEADLAFRSLNFVFGTRPASNYSLVSGVGADSQLVAYGMNRADFSFIPGGIVPGILVLPPDFPENKDNWPFFWGQNEYVITVGGSYMFLANAVQDLLEQQ
ncbi:glycoside hydrolase family 9 protein [Marinimicrobium sp. ABcell2]|uniref:glycoside hydrolase family 9 protein n=1 Tax=Marinimicrobium sp. ABcell2 TaxID=3069751 RepID=UPI0027B2D57A|nr:glycoside hydrolase family 9 protein [Marinimicrobium sp. ABcell2]MDQ2075965.1 glycoside hydrolase family 9 protein [Marinimicrobium sp. ABcell2]